MAQMFVSADATAAENQKRSKKHKVGGVTAAAVVETVPSKASTSGKSEAPAPAVAVKAAPAPAAVSVAPAPAAAPAVPAAIPPASPAPSEEAIPAELLTPAAPASGGNAEVYDPNTVDVVKVTVDRREQNIQDYAGSASAYTEEDLTRVGVTSVRDLSQVNPSLEIGTQEGNTEIFIRGVGSTNNTELGDPSAATHVDGIYIPRPRGVGSMFFDLERVELNRGPQGTIRGRNATAGSLNIITAKPKLGLFGAEGSIQMGNYMQRMTRAMVNIPLTDTLALRFASFSENHDSYYKNGGPVTNLTPAESADTLAYRASAKWVPLSFITVNVGHDYTHEGGTSSTGTNFEPALRAGLLPSEVPDPRSVVMRGPQPFQKLTHWGLNGDISAKLGPLVVNYIGGYRNLTYHQVTGGSLGVAFPGKQYTNTDLDNWTTNYWFSASQSQVHELRIMAAETARFRWTLGGFAFNEKQQVTLLQAADNSNGFAGVEFNMPNVKGSSQAGYFDGVFDIFKWLRGTGGLRFTRETKERTGLGAVWIINNAAPNGQPNFRYGTEGFQPNLEGRTMYVTPGQAYDPNALFLNGVTSFGIRDTVGGRLSPAGIGALDPGAISPQFGKYEKTFLDFRVGGDMDLNPDQMLYVNLTTGHSSGGFNDNINYTINGITTNIAPTYKPESLYAIEAGSKNELFDHKLRINAAAFLYLYRDQIFQIIQATGPAPDPMTPPPGSAVRVNAGKSHILGLDFDGAYRLPFGLMVSVAGLLMDAKFDSGEIFDNRQAFGPTGQASDKVNVKGKTLPRAPRVTLNYSVSQNIQTRVGWFDWIATAQSRSEYFMTVFNGKGKDVFGNINPQLSDNVPAYTRLDLGIGYTRPSGKARISMFANNVTNLAYMTSFITQPGVNLRYFNAPRQVGVRLNLYF